jgi:outer membrane protein assembly factor BamB
MPNHEGIRASFLDAYGRAPVYEIATLPDTAPHHVIVGYVPGRLVAYLDGQKTFETDQVAGSLKVWGNGELCVGDNHNGGCHAWLGKIEGVAIDQRFLEADEAGKIYAAIMGRLKSRKVLAQNGVEAKLLATSRIRRWMRNSPMRRILTWFWVLCLPAVVRADNWPQFRGPNGSGVSTETNLPSEWSPDKNVAWKLKDLGVAWSSPIVWGDRLFLTTAVPEEKIERPSPRTHLRDDESVLEKVIYRWEVHCLDATTGQAIWNKVAARHKPTLPIHPKNSYATETPVTDGERVYAYFGSDGVYCYDFTGRLLWNKSLGTLKMRHGWGTASSPVLDGGRLFIQCDHEDNSFLVALDVKDGHEVWRISRDEKSNWGTPFIWRNKVRTELVTLGNRVRSYDPATGKQFWELGPMATTITTTPVATADLLYVGSASMPFNSERPLFAVRPGSSGDLTLPKGQKASAAIAWCQPQNGPTMPSPLVHDGCVYVVQETGLITCHDAQTGQRFYKERLPREEGRFTTSPWAYDGKVFVTSEEGNTFVLQAGPKFRLLRKNSFPDEMFMATPAIANGSLYLRGRDYLYCIRQMPAAVRAKR